MCEQNRSRCDGEQLVSGKLLLEEPGATELAWNGLGVPGRQPFLYIFQALCVSIFGSITFWLFWFSVFLFWCRSSGYLSQAYLELLGIQAAKSAFALLIEVHPPSYPVAFLV